MYTFASCIVQVRTGGELFPVGFKEGREKDDHIRIQSKLKADTQSSTAPV